MTTRPWMPLYIADYLGDTAHLGALQSGAYLHLIMHYWQHGGLPNNEAALTRIARLTPSEWNREREVLASFFHDSWKHKRIDAELAHVADVSGKRRAAAEEGRSKRAAKADAIALTNETTHARGLPDSKHQKDSNLSENQIAANGAVLAETLATLIKGSARKVSQSDYLWLKPTDTRLPRAQQWALANLGCEFRMEANGSKAGYRVPWAAVR